MHAYRTHTCGALRATDAGTTVRLSGWVHSKRDHGGLLFIDLRDHYGLTQLVFPAGAAAFATADAVRPESVITVTGEVVRREGSTINPRLPTGEIEVRDDDVGGIAVHVAARVMGQSVADEVLVSRVVTDLVAGAELKFAERGSFGLKGIPGSWDLFAAIR